MIDAGQRVDSDYRIWRRALRVGKAAQDEEVPRRMQPAIENFLVMPPLTAGFCKLDVANGSKINYPRVPRT
ncbi:MAG TPA: hypothetical protein PLO14_06325 [Accumulibacter sp.]|uniref:hypothetical protein n=1 Tax=Accumulibacter sp. TaxID=2053492 RepID=UPI0025DAE28D|nr:hypothetical protein [Accumulibacter sp.]MCM8598775.1 hypothetical protein [Accumulibacter sp.]MCM8663827.1 hypothetical protein [Accumulibacter sp.]HNC51842.1 hypothetical protein [Accumulibacter sp.]